MTNRPFASVLFIMWSQVADFDFRNSESGYHSESLQN